MKGYKYLGILEADKHINKNEKSDLKIILQKKDSVNITESEWMQHR